MNDASDVQGRDAVVLATVAAACESPSLSPPGEGGPAFELKFLVDEAQARAVEAWACRRLALDPHGDPALGGAYRTNSLYLDTPELDVYRRSPKYRRRKYRIRAYGAAPWAFLERKTKSGDRVAKRRTAVPQDEMAQLAHPLGLVSWPGHWFHRRLLRRRLQPACLITYQRTAYVGFCPEGPLRLTLDRRLRCAPASAWSLAPADPGRVLLPDRVILEMKFRQALPAPFKEVVQELCLNPSPVSKYRLGREAWGVALAATPPCREAADA